MSYKWTNYYYEQSGAVRVIVNKDHNDKTITITRESSLKVFLSDVRRIQDIKILYDVRPGGFIENVTSWRSNVYDIILFDDIVIL